MFKNILLNVDSYKSSHYLQYPPGTEYVSSYIESRGGAYPATLFFGLQAFLKEYLNKPITADDIDEAQAFFVPHGLPFNDAGWRHILNKHGGYLPIEIRAVAEGSIVPTGNVLVQMQNTDPAVPGLTSYLETVVLRAIWYPTTVATLSYEAKKIIQRFLTATGDDAPDFKLHDFGARGVSSLESAAIGGAAHLVNFMGSDTVSGILGAKRWYNEPMAGFSIPAAEHSTITSWGKHREATAYENMLDKFEGMVAVVSDSYDIYKACSEIWGVKLHDKVMARKAPLVIRPDSGEPTEVVPAIIERLMEKFGATDNSKRYRVLPKNVRVIQGDGVNPKSIEAILMAMTDAKQSADNIAFGMGGGLLQQVNRDTMKFAMKASAIQINGMWEDVYKAPVTDAGKVSKKGRLALRKSDGKYETVRVEDCHISKNALERVFLDGSLLRNQSFAEIRKLAAQG